MNILNGRSASPGISSGTAYIYEEQSLAFESVIITDVEAEIKRLDAAIVDSKKELHKIKDNLTGDLGEEFGHIFRAQITMVEDEEFHDEVVEVIRDEKLCTEAALDLIFSGYSEAFASLGEDDYNKQRLLDLTDIYKRILRNLLGLEEKDLSSLPPHSMVMAVDLMPSDTALMNKDNVVGLITEKGGVTSHVAILAKSLGIAAAVGVAGAMNQNTKGKTILLDATDFEKAEIIIDPDVNQLSDFKAAKVIYDDKLDKLQSFKNLEAITTDGKKIELSANIGSIDDLDNALEYGAKGVGLLRTEFFFLDTTTLPDEEKQYHFYKEAAEKLEGGMLIIRTLDIGGDKEVKCFDLPKEDNPFLGLRGIRVCIKHREIFKTQVKAVLRAASHGNIKMMYPMVADISELRYSRELISECAEELSSNGVEFNKDIEVGVMVETPAAVMISDILTEECDFVSIGTNDLTQYLLCADRINENVSEYYRIFSPAVFRALKVVADNVHKNKKWVGICGELGGIPMVIPILVGLGIDELSMTAQRLPEAISIIRSLSYDECKKMAEELLILKTDEEIKEFLQQIRRN